MAREKITCEVCGSATLRYSDTTSITREGRELAIIYRMCPFCGARLGIVRDLNTGELLQQRTVTRDPCEPGRYHPPTLCWDCQRAAGPVENRCSWSLELRPVKGWTARKSRIIEGSYYVKKCPLFTPDEPRKVQPW